MVQSDPSGPRAEPSDEPSPLNGGASPGEAALLRQLSLRTAEIALLEEQVATLEARIEVLERQPNASASGAAQPEPRRTETVTVGSAAAEPQGRLADALAELEYMRNSRTWRYTAPARALMRELKNRYRF